MNLTETRSVLISGAGIAGPALAFWLARYGFRTTLVEGAARLREGGQAVDFRGAVHIGVLGRMGLLEAARARQAPMGEQRFVDASGQTLFTIAAAFLSGDLEILRGDLCRLLFEATRDNTTYLFGDSIQALHETSDSVQVRFEKAAADRFDIVVGADGLHSRVRALHFGPEREFVQHLGYYVAGFSLPNEFGFEGMGCTYSAVGRGLHLQPVSRSEARASFIFAAAEQSSEARDQGAQKRIVEDTFAGLGWHVPRALAAMQRAPEMYFDAIARVRVPAYARGRVVLLGDAAYGGTIGGGGAGCALVGAYVLAGELAASRDYASAFARYEEKLRPYATACQAGADDVGPIFAPKTRARLWMRNRVFRLLGWPPLASLFARLASSDAARLSLPEY